MGRIERTPDDHAMAQIATALRNLAYAATCQTAWAVKVSGRDALTQEEFARLLKRTHAALSQAVDAEIAAIRKDVLA